MKVWRLGPDNLFAHASRDIDDGAPIPAGYVPEEPSAAIKSGAALGYYAGGRWIELAAPPAPVQPIPEPQLPELVITGIDVDAAHTAETSIKPSLDDVTCPAGTTLTFHAALRQGTDVVPLTDTFRMPVRSRAGGEMMLAVEMVAGLATVTVTMSQSGAWFVTEDTINQDLPPGRRMRFGGIRVFVTANAA